MESVIFRFCIVWLMLHIILFFIERYRYKHSSWSWYGFKNDGMFDITYLVLTIDIVGSILGILSLVGYFILNPIIK